jgi:thioredoxin 1
MHKDVTTEEQLNAEVASGRVLVDFWAQWCGPCRMMAQVIDNEIIPSMSDLKVVKVNVDEAPELAAKFNVMSIPALFCFKDGVKTAEFVGVTSVAQIRAAL